VDFSRQLERRPNIAITFLVVFPKANALASNAEPNASRRFFIRHP
jgi:hypothetical protein